MSELLTLAPSCGETSPMELAGAAFVGAAALCIAAMGIALLVGLLQVFREVRREGKR